MNSQMIHRRIPGLTDGARIVCALVPFMIAVAAIAQAPSGGAKTEDKPTANPPAATNNMANPPRRGSPGGFGFGHPALLPAGVKAERNIPYVENGHRNQVPMSAGTVCSMAATRARKRARQSFTSEAGVTGDG